MKRARTLRPIAPEPGGAMIGHWMKGRQVAALRLLPILGICLLLSAAALTSCRRERDTEPSVSVQTEIVPQPVSVGPVTVTVQLADSHQIPIGNAKVAVEGDMAHAGMSPVVAEARELPQGRYQASLNLGMAGDWVILLRIRLANGETLDRQVDVKNVRSN